MNDRSKYLYENAQTGADERLRSLEAIEDQNSISLLENLTDLEGCICLEIGAGAGSMAGWLASKVGAAGAVTATDIEPKHLAGSRFEVLRHDIEKDELPMDHYDLVYIRHLLIHLAHPLEVLKKIYSSMKPSAVILAEESNLDTWKPDESTPEEISDVFRRGVNAMLRTYDSHGMDVRIGTKLAELLSTAGFMVIEQRECKRSVLGGSPEAQYQSKSADQLADFVGRDGELGDSIKGLARCLLIPELRYQSRTTISVSAKRYE